MDVYILGIESSCDEMSASIIKNGNTEIKTIVLSQMDIHKKYGGVVPEIASRCHIESATMVLEELFEGIDLTMNDITAIAITYGPGLIGSLLVGLQIAKTLAFVYNKPLVPVHHIAGHIYANNLVEEMKFPLISLVVSGGHTDIIYMKDHFEFEKIGGTLDDAVGECYDKVARVLDLPYPGGPQIDRLSKEGNDIYKLPLPLDDDSFNFSFSGLKSAVINLVHNEEQRGNVINKADLATSFQNTVVKIITKKTMKAIEKYNVNKLIMSGGVAANKALREKFETLCNENNINFSVPPIKYCTDNAAMIATAGYFAYIKGLRSDMTLNAVAVDSLYNYVNKFRSSE
ncbi:MAG: tRNA (adenosine(37)-N6)-threonylcarbamoyltransferase complex transferase subunit TsaD [Bacilli bacterium]|nr:tRNA (adenosine(37)-N6)-threonylcarbamoyltransferase complex transferase subunit TsaD [Bacilli bacterium]